MFNQEGNSGLRCHTKAGLSEKAFLSKVMYECNASRSQVIKIINLFEFFQHFIKFTLC